MGIFGFGSLRDRFARTVPRGTLTRGSYVACFDVTPLVVYSVRHSCSEDEFAILFQRRMNSCKEIRFLRETPPFALRYTLDNRAPRAKRQTQMRRLIESRSVVNRLTSMTAFHDAIDAQQRSNVVVSSTTDDYSTVSHQQHSHLTGVVGATAHVLTIRDVAHRVREILLRHFVLTDDDYHHRRRKRRSGAHRENEEPPVSKTAPTTATTGNFCSLSRRRSTSRKKRARYVSASPSRSPIATGSPQPSSYRSLSPRRRQRSNDVRRPRALSRRRESETCRDDDETTVDPVIAKEEPAAATVRYEPPTSSPRHDERRTSERCYSRDRRGGIAADNVLRRESDDDGREDDASFAASNRVTFDHDEGEGEIKAINWLYRQPERYHRLIMVRDNDVFVYALSKLWASAKSSSMPRRPSAATVASIARAIISRLHDREDVRCDESDDAAAANEDQHRRRRSRLFRDDDHERNDTAVVALSKRSDSVETLCDSGATTASDTGSDSGGSVSDGNNIAGDGCGSTDAINTISTPPRFRSATEKPKLFVFHEGSNNVLICWEHLKAHESRCWILLLWINVCFGNDFTFGILDKSVATMSHCYNVLEARFVNRDNRGDPKDDTREDESRGTMIAERDIVTTESSQLRRREVLLANAFIELQTLLRGDRATAMERSNDDWYDRRRYDENDPSIIRKWLVRQVWSFLYALELPSEFTSEQKFENCPNLSINAHLDKPYVSMERFLRLSENDIRSHLSSILRDGI